MLKGIYAQQVDWINQLINETKLPLAIRDKIFTDHPAIVDKYSYVNFSLLNVPDDFKFIYDNGSLCLDFTFVDVFLNSLENILPKEKLVKLTKDFNEVTNFTFYFVVDSFKQEEINISGMLANNRTLYYANESLAVINRDLKRKYGYTLTNMFKSYLGIPQLGFSRLYMLNDHWAIDDQFKKWNQLNLPEQQSNETQRSNMSKIDEYTYIVRTQAGFRKALKDFRGNFSNGDEGIDNYPKIYPALIVLNNQYNGGKHINTCKVYPLFLLKQIVNIMETT